jgi:Protein of unknown function (DUF2726)
MFVLVNKKDSMNAFGEWTWLLVALLVASLMLVIFLLWQRTAPIAPVGKLRPFRMEDWQPRTMRPLTRLELRAFIELRRALPECLLLPQISLARFLNVPQNRSYTQWFGSVGRRCVDFLVCSEQGDVLGVFHLQSAKPKKTTSEGTQRKLKALEMAQIPIWHLPAEELPDAKTIRSMVLPELQAAEQHSQMISVLNAEPEWQATRMEPRPKVEKKPAEAEKSDRWDQEWPSEDTRSTSFLDQFGMIEAPPLVVKGSGRSATGFTRG